MTDKNDKMRSILTKVEHICTSSLRNQPQDEKECERLLTKALINVADVVRDFSDLVEIKISDIEWETDGEEVDLPKSIRKFVKDPDNYAVTHVLSDEYGWLVLGCRWRKIQ